MFYDFFGSLCFLHLCIYILSAKSLQISNLSSYTKQRPLSAIKISNIRIKILPLLKYFYPAAKGSRCPHTMHPTGYATIGNYHTHVIQMQCMLYKYYYNVGLRHFFYLKIA